MKIRDAKPGDVLRDRDRDVWLRLDGEYAAVLTVDGGKRAAPPHQWACDDAAQFGPFTRLVPEREGE